MYKDTGLDIFISVSLKYPQLNAVRYEASDETLILEVAVRQKITPDRRLKFQKRVRESIAAFYRLKGKKEDLINIEFRECREGITFLRYYRDIHTISEEEIEIFMELLGHEFENQIITDTENIIIEDAFKMQVKKNLMKKINQGITGATSFLAYREDGRVLVFNK